MAIELI